MIMIGTLENLGYVIVNETEKILERTSDELGMALGTSFAIPTDTVSLSQKGLSQYRMRPKQST